ncbi:hypothetical protein HMPREF0734_00888 [Rothia dentocariosa M567]|nr:hypothetical protein HMPREF0734_00888 [Rothia dentocariosa M567]
MNAFPRVMRLLLSDVQADSASPQLAYSLKVSPGLDSFLRIVRTTRFVFKD